MAPLKSGAGGLEDSYQTAFQGKNGFVCVVQRSWATAFDDAEFWNPKLRAPVCFNPETGIPR
jgi:hypothetical protein